MERKGGRGKERKGRGRVRDLIFILMGILSKPVCLFWLTGSLKKFNF